MNTQQKQVMQELISRTTHPDHYKQMNEQNNCGLDDLKQIDDELKRVQYFRKGLSAVKDAENRLVNPSAPLSLFS